MIFWIAPPSPVKQFCHWIISDPDQSPSDISSDVFWKIIISPNCYSKLSWIVLFWNTLSNMTINFEKMLRCPKVMKYNIFATWTYKPLFIYMNDAIQAIMNFRLCIYLNQNEFSFDLVFKDFLASVFFKQAIVHSPSLLYKWSHFFGTVYPKCHCYFIIALL